MSLWLALGLPGGVWDMLAWGASLALGLSLGGILSYGLLIGYATGERGRTGRSPLFGLLGLFLVGGLWGFFGGLSAGLLGTGAVYDIGDLGLWAVTASLGAFAAYKLLVVGLDLHLSPPRSDAWAAVLGGAIATAVFFLLGPRDQLALRSALAGWVGFGGGFSFGVLVHRIGDEAGMGFSRWKFIEHSVGFFGGLALAISTHLMRDAFQPVVIQDPALRLWALSVLVFATYMVVANNVEFWVLELGRCSRKVFALFHASVLICIPVFAWLALGIVRAHAGLAGSKGLFALLMILYTLIGTAKFVRDRSGLTSKVVQTFVLQLGICLTLLALL